MTHGSKISPEAANPLAVSQDTLLNESGLLLQDLERSFGRLLIGSVDAADLYFQRSRSESWLLEDGIVKDGTTTRL